MNGQDENSTGQDSSKLLDLFGKLSLSKSTDDGDDTVKVSKENESASSIRSHQSATPSTSSTPSESSDQVNLPSGENKSSESRFKSKAEKLKEGYSWAVWNGVSFLTPFPDDPIIDGMDLKNCNLDKSFSTETSSLTAPKRLGHFSCRINPDGKSQSYRPDKSSARYLFYHPSHKLKMNLLEGFSETFAWGRVPPGEMHLLRWFSENSFELMNDNGNSSVDFICYTRMLRSIMQTPYNVRDDWVGIAIKVRGSIIIDEIDSPQRQSGAKEQSYHQKASSYAGYKFEELITRRYDGIKSPTRAEGNRDSFYIVSKAKLNNHTILYTNRVDCAQNKRQLYEDVDKMKVAQIKTRTTWTNSKFFWQNRAITWWIESWLGNIDLIICGDKDKDFHIEKVTRMWVNRLPNERNRWSPRTCVSFLDLVLAFIKTMVTDELTPYRFYCAPGNVIVCQKINEPVEKYLPTWFINNQEPDDN